MMRTNGLNEIQLADFQDLYNAGYGYGYGVRTLLDPEKGNAIARGMDVEILKEDLTLIQKGSGNPYTDHQKNVDDHDMECPHCGYHFKNDDFEFCPKCGKRL